MPIGRRVVELQMGEAVVFSPADQPTEAETGPQPESTATGGRPAPRGKPSPILDGVEALTKALARAGYKGITEAVAAHSVFLHPATVSQTLGKGLFRLVRDPVRRGTLGSLPDGTPVFYDDNTGPKLAFLWAARRITGPDVQYNHVWGNPRNVDTYTALWNLCATPAFLAKTTDGSNHPEVQELLKYRAFDLYGFLPVGEKEPSRPGEYDSLKWPEPPEPVENLESLIRQRLADAPKSRPSVSARELGWLFSDGPDKSIPAPLN